MNGLGCGLCSLAFPYAAKYGTSITFAYIIRIIMGATQGALFPSTYVILCEWLTKSERSTWLPWPSTFSRFGAIAMYLIVPIIMQLYDWEMVFYISGVACLTWVLIFIIFASDCPSQSFWISKKELAHIELNQELPAPVKSEPSLTASGFELNAAQCKPQLSWTKVATNKGVYILSLVMFTSEWSNMLLLVKLPGFLGPVFNMDVAEVSIEPNLVTAQVNPN